MSFLKKINYDISKESSEFPPCYGVYRFVMILFISLFKMNVTRELKGLILNMRRTLDMKICLNTVRDWSQCENIENVFS